MLVVSLLTAIARAADCAAPVAIDEVLGDLGNVEAALRTGDDATAGKAAIVLEGGVGCLNEVLPRMIAGRTLRAIGAGMIAGGQTDRGLRWLRTAAEIEQAYEFGIEDLPANHPVRGVYADAIATSSGEEVPVPGKELAATSYLDGKKVTAAKAREERFHLYQLDSGAGVRTWIIDGNDFPAEGLTAAAVAAAEPAPVETGKPPKAPKPAKEPKEPKAPKPAPVASVEPEPEPAPEPKPPKPAKAPKPAPAASVGPSGTVTLERKRPPEKTPILIGGGLLAGGAGVLWYLSYDKRQEFEDSNSLAELEALQPQVNRLFVASVALLGVGAGTFTWGVILDGGTPMPSMSFRF